MNKLKFLFIILLILSPVNIFCQDFAIKAETGYGFYNMKSLEGLQNDLAESFQPLTLKPVQKFPPYFNYEFQFLGKFSPDISFGVFFQYLTTGGRVALSDYSGSINIDQVLNGYNVGIVFESYILKEHLKNLLFTLHVSVIYSTLSLSQSVKVYTFSQNTGLDFTSTGVAIEPGLAYEIMTSPFILRANAGLHYDTSGDFKYTGNDNSKLNNTYPDWSGLRLGLTVGYPF